MDTDLKLRKRVIQELEWEPSVDATQLNVEISEGVVFLTGTVSSYAEKRAAEEAVRPVKGVRAVVEGIDVKLPDESRRADADIAKAAAAALEWDVRVPEHRVMITVEQGTITLDGDVDLQYQRDAAERAVAGLTGVTRVVNKIRELPVSQFDDDLRIRIARAIYSSPHFRGYGSMVNPPIHIIVEHGRVTLEGVVNNNVDRMIARSIASNFLSFDVKNELKTTQEAKEELEKL